MGKGTRDVLRSASCLVVFWCRPGVLGEIACESACAPAPRAPHHGVREVFPATPRTSFDRFRGNFLIGLILWGAANVLQNKLTRAQYLDEVTLDH